MSVQLDRTFYYPGQMVNGKVFINAQYPFKCAEMTLSCEGKEKASWTRYYYVTKHKTRRVRRDGRWVTEHYTVRVEKHQHMEKKKKAMDFKVPIMNMGSLDYTVNQGNYMATFQFQLPHKISSSMYFSHPGCREKPEVKIAHKVKIKLTGTGLPDPPKSKAEIVVRQLPIGVDTFQKKLENEAIEYFCYNKGKTKTEAQFAGNFYDKNEIAYCQFNVDNKDCKLGIKELRYQFRHQLSIHIGGHTYVYNKAIA